MDEWRRRLEVLDLNDVVLGERVEGLDGVVHRGHRRLEIPLRVVGDHLHLVGDLLDGRLILGHLGFGLVGLDAVLVHLDDHHLSLLGLALELGLQRRERLLHAVDHRVRLGQLFDADLEALDAHVHDAALDVELAQVERDQLEERLGRHVEAPLKLREELLRHVDDGRVDDGRHVDQTRQDRHAHLGVVAELEGLEELLGDALERLDGPPVVPVDGAAVDERREHAAAHAERGADGRHREYDVQVLARAVHKEFLQIILGLGDLAILGERAHSVGDLLPLIVREEVGHLARVEDVVDVLDEGLLDDLCVGEEEDDRRADDALLVLVAARGEEALFEVLAELDGAVPLG